jgi:predicted O-methyltransferase YrrM
MENDISKIKQELEQTRKEFWNIDPEAGAVLQALIHAAKPQNILEVGTSNGYSAIIMGEIASRYGAHITSIEFFPERLTLAKQNIDRAGLTEHISILQGDAAEILPNLAEQQHLYQFIFLDANKEEYALYFTNVMKMIASRGIIVADNTISHRKKLGAFFDAIQNEPRANALELSIGTGLTIITIS